MQRDVGAGGSATIVIIDYATGASASILTGVGFNCFAFRPVIDHAPVDVIWAVCAGIVVGDQGDDAEQADQGGSHRQCSPLHRDPTCAPRPSSLLVPSIRDATSGVQDQLQPSVHGPTPAMRSTVMWVT